MNFKLLKKIARSNSWQMIYSRAKELSTLRLFKNDMNLTKVQIWMLYFLEMYSSLYTDLAMNEDFLSEEIIQDDLRVEAYLLLRKQKRKEKSNYKWKDKNIDREETSKLPKVVFQKREVK